MYTKKTLSLLGIILLIIGLIIIVFSFQTFTGFTILEQIGESGVRLLGIVFFASGIILLTISRGWDRYRVGMVIKEYDNGELNPIQAAMKINDRIFPEGVRVTGVEYHHDDPFTGTIRTKEEYIPIKLKDQNKARDLALALYEIAIINDRANIKNCELHLARNISTKHHAQNLTGIIKKFEERYHSDLELAKKH